MQTLKEQLQKAKARIEELETSEVLIDTTDETYNIQIKAVKSGNVVTVSIYTTKLATAMDSGTLNYTLATLPTGSRPAANIRQMCQNSSGNRFILAIMASGEIQLGYIYSTSGTGGNYQIIERTTFIIE